MLLVALCIVTNFFVLALLQPAIDFKALRDLLMPAVFIWLGYFVNDRRVSERVLRNLAIVAVVIGLVEFIFPTFYTSLFDTIAFYQSRGFGGNNPFALTVLQVRPLGIGRSLLPFLGPRRISSFFLEPVALGNFAVLTAAWALSKPREEWREGAVLMLLAATMTCWPTRASDRSRSSCSAWSGPVTSGVPAWSPACCRSAAMIFMVSSPSTVRPSTTTTSSVASRSRVAT